MPNHNGPVGANRPAVRLLTVTARNNLRQLFRDNLLSCAEFEEHMLIVQAILRRARCQPRLR